MLFRVHDVDGKFIQYISICIDATAVGTSTFNAMCARIISCSNIPKAPSILSASCNYFNWMSESLTIVCYAAHYVPVFSLVEILSKQRMEDIKRIEKENNTIYKTSNDGWYLNNTSTTISNAGITYTYTPSFTISYN